MDKGVDESDQAPVAGPGKESIYSTVNVGERLDNVPIYSFHRKVLGRVGIGEWFDNYDLYAVSYVLAALLAAHFLTLSQVGIVLAGQFSGMAAGSILLGITADRYGRRHLFLWTLLAYSIFTIILALSVNWQMMTIARFFAGAAMAAQYILVDTYLGETIPKAKRGKYVVYAYTIGFTAATTVAFISFLLVPRTFFLAGWRWVFLIGGFGALLFWPLVRKLTETPRWYELKGEYEKADRLVKDIELGAAAELNITLPPVKTDTKVEKETKVPLKEAFSGKYGKRLLGMSIIQFMQSIGYFGFASFTATILVTRGFTITHALFYSFLIAIFIPIGGYVGSLFAEVFQRRWQIGILSLLVAADGLAFAYSPTIVLIVITGVILSILTNWYSPVIHAYQEEMFPTRIRASAGGFGYAMSRVSGALSSYIIAYLLMRSVQDVFIFVGSVMVVIFITVIFMPNSNKMELEKVAS